MAGMVTVRRVSRRGDQKVSVSFTAESGAGWMGKSLDWAKVVEDKGARNIREAKRFIEISWLCLKGSGDFLYTTDEFEFEKFCNSKRFAPPFQAGLVRFHDDFAAGGGDFQFGF